MEKEIALLNSRGDLCRTFKDNNIREALREERVGAIAEIAGPKADLRIEFEFLHQLKQAQIMSDVSDILALPGIAQENARRAPSWRERRKRGEQSGSER